MDHSDRQLGCASCGQTFLFTGGEQAYYAQNGFQEPRRCKPCRAQRKQGGDFAGGGGGGGSGGRGRDAGGQGAPRTGGSDTRGNRRPGGMPNRAFQTAAPDDPNGYRAPGFQTQNQQPYRIDYAGLPQDEEQDDEKDGQAAMLGSREATEVDRFGLRTNAPTFAYAPRVPMGGGNGGGGGGGMGNSNTRGAALPRGMNGRRPDRAGTDPNAYRSPGFANPAPAVEARAAAPQGEPGGARRRSRRPQRMRHEAVCADCGVQALVPFQPGPDRPAYCKPCYQVRKANGTVPLSAMNGGADASGDATDSADAADDQSATDSAGE